MLLNWVQVTYNGKDLWFLFYLYNCKIILQLNS